MNQRRPLRVVPAGRPRGSSAHPGAAAPPTAGLPAAAAARDPRGRAAAAQRFSHANRRPLTGRWRAAGSGCASRGVAAMMPALAAHRRGCRGLYRLYLRCQAAPLPRSCHGESLKARRAAWRRGAAGTPPGRVSEEGVIELRARVRRSEYRRSQAAGAGRARAPAGAERDGPLRAGGRRRAQAAIRVSARKTEMFRS